MVSASGATVVARSAIACGHSLAVLALVLAGAGCAIRFAPLNAANDSAQETGVIDADVVDERMPFDVLDAGDAVDSTLPTDVTMCGDGGVLCGMACVDLQFDNRHCGACDNACLPRSNADHRCASGRCTLMCMTGFANCDAMEANGCETDTRSSSGHCGGCGMACVAPAGGTTSCEMGRCADRCPAGTVAMGGACVGDPAAAASCPGLPVAVVPGREVVVANTTVGRRGDSDGSGSCGGFAGEDAVFAVTPSAAGRLFLDVDSTFDAGVYVRTNCTMMMQIQCASATPRAGRESLNFDVVAGTTYYVVVDSRPSLGGAFALHLRLASCGDGVLDSGENCDDGNTAPGDGCDASCRVESAAAASDTCPSSPAPFRLTPGMHFFRGTTAGARADMAGMCGGGGGGSEDVVYVFQPTMSGQVRAQVRPANDMNAAIYVAESCGGLASSPTCSDRMGDGRTERLTFMVDRSRTYYFVVDTSGGSAGSFVLTLILGQCGDGVQGPGEECDDGNLVDGDGCTTTCTNEASCVVSESEPNGSGATATALPRCPLARANASIAPAADNDFFSVTLMAGQTLDLTTFSGGTGDCNGNPDTVIEITRSLAAAVAGATNCGGSTALLCNDDVATGIYCSELRYYVPESGTYYVRAFAYDYRAGIAAYSLQSHARVR